MRGTLSRVILCSTLMFGLIINGDERTFDREILNQYQMYCPYADLCYSEANQTFRGMDRDIPCCGYCLCDESCRQTHSCCPDKLSHFETPEEEIRRIKAVVTECVYAQLRVFQPEKYNGKSYTMVSRCPGEFDNDDVRHRCTRNYDQFDFNENLKYLPPLSSSESRIIYKNYYCALCHGAEMTTLQQWMSKLECVEFPRFQFTDVKQIPQILANESSCQLEFIPPSSDSSLAEDMMCVHLEERCNVTGYWQHYDMEIEYGCLSYLSPYKGYKNVHCFLCNEYNITDVVDTCERPQFDSSPPTFIALLDFNDLERDSSLSATKNKQIQCEHSSVFDAESEICRQMVCPGGFRIVGHKCVPLLKEVKTSLTGVVIEIPFILVPSEPPQEDTMDDFYKIARLISNTAFQNVDLIRTAKYSRWCTINMYIKLKNKLEDVLDHMILTNNTSLVPYVSHLEVMVQVSVHDLENMSKTINEIAILFVENEYYGQYNVRFKHFGYKYDQIELDTKTVIWDKILEFERVIGDRLYFDTSIAIISGFDDPIDGLGVLIIPGYEYSKNCEAMLIVQPSPFCGRIELSSAEFNISTSTKSATGNRINMAEASRFTYHFSSVIETANGNSVLVCVDEFIQQSSKHTNAFQKIDPDRNQESILTIVCLVISLASLVLTIVVYCMLPQLRTLPGLNIMALSLALIKVYALSLTNSLTELAPSSVSCKIIGLFLHFSLLSVFSWMFICIYHLMRVFLTIKERSQAKHNRKIFIRYILFAEIVPLLLVCVTVIVSVVSKNGIGYGGTPCYIKPPPFILYFVAIPLALVVISNITMFSLVTTMVVRMPHVASSTKEERNNLLIFLKLSSLTGFAWIFGFLYQFSEVLLFAYLFIICNAGQGVFIMLSFVVNKQVFEMLRGKMKYVSKSSPESRRTATTTLDSTATNVTKF